MAVTRETNVYVGIGRRIEELRKKKGDELGSKFTQEMLAQAIGVNRSLVAKWESYSRKISAEEMNKVCDFFGVSLDYLLTGVNPENRTISSELGLNEESINTLKKYVNDKTYRAIVNTFLSEENEELRRFCRSWPHREFFEVYDQFRRLDVLMHWDREGYIEGLSKYNLLFNTLSYSLNVPMIEEYFKRFLNLVSKNYWFDGDEEKYKERVAEIKQEYEKALRDSYFKGGYDELPPDLKASIDESIKRELYSDL